jgi:DNA-binding XRE family transcriptional regulator
MKGKDFKAMRTRLRLTQKVLAERLGVNLQTVKSWEVGRNPIDQRTKLQLQALGRELNLHRKKGNSMSSAAIETTHSRAHVHYLNFTPTAAEARRIETALAARYNDSIMVGRVDIELTREREGVRVTSADIVSYSEQVPRPTDVRDELIGVLRAAGVKLAHDLGRRREQRC